MNMHTPEPLSDGLRHSLPLTEGWAFRHESDAADTWRRVTLPHLWNIAHPELAVDFGTGTYRRQITLPEAYAGRHVVLRFEAASSVARVAIDGTEVAQNDNPWLPFEVQCPDQGSFELEVTVTLPDARHETGADFAEIPHGKWSWYGPQGGLWQPVRLEARAATHLTDLRIDPLLNEARIDIRAAYTGAAQVLDVVLFDQDGAVVAEAELPAEGGSLDVPDPQPWSPDRPTLYTLSAALMSDGQKVDARAETIGFRTFESRDGKFYLNGEPFYMRGALDQDYYPDGGGIAPSLALLEDQLRKAKALGLNLLRCHIKVPDPRYYEVADRLGMLIWTEIPNIETFTDRSAKVLRDTMEGILRRDRNHPSIIAWTIINEDWGTRLRESAPQRQWLSDMVDWLRAEDPLRMVVDNSACFPNFHVKTDINDFHFYRTAVERREEWQLLCKELAEGGPWSFGDAPECQRTGDEPLVLSEFGVWGLPDPARLRGNGQDPWWMRYGCTWADHTVYPVGIEERFAELGLARHFGSFPAFIEAVQWHQYENLKWEIEVLRSHDPVAGYVITEFTDVHWEGNGLLDMARNPRVFAEVFADVNADLVIAPNLPQHFARAGEDLVLDLHIATGGQALPEGCTLHTEVEGAGFDVALPAIDALAAQAVPVTVTIPEGAARSLPLFFRVVDGAGRVLARSQDRVAVLGARKLAAATVEATTPELTARMGDLGYGAGGDVIVTDVLTPELIERIEAGAHVLQLIDKAPGRLRDDTPPRDGPTSIEIDAGAGGMESGHYFTFPGYGLVDRHKSIYRGDWVGNFSWIDRDLFPEIPGGPLLDLAFTSVVPEQVMTGFRAWEFHGRVHSGVVVGWVHKPGAFLIEKRLGKGKLVATTFRVGHGDAMAVALTDGLMRLAARP